MFAKKRICIWRIFCIVFKLLPPVRWQTHLPPHPTQIWSLTAQYCSAININCIDFSWYWWQCLPPVRWDPLFPLLPPTYWPPRGKTLPVAGAESAKACIPNSHNTQYVIQKQIQTQSLPRCSGAAKARIQNSWCRMWRISELYQLLPQFDFLKIMGKQVCINI